jgi:hypothetical protein
MTKNTNSKRHDAGYKQLVLVIGISNLEFVCNLVLVIWDLNYFGACVLVIAINCTNTNFKSSNEPRIEL